MANNIEYRKAYTAILDEVYQRASVSGCLTSGNRMVRQGAHAKEIMIPRIEVSGLGDYVRNQGYAQGAIQFSYESHSPDYNRGLKLVADVTYEYYSKAYGGGLTEAAFSSCVSMAESHVKWRVKFQKVCPFGRRCRR